MRTSYVINDISKHSPEEIAREHRKRGLSVHIDPGDTWGTLTTIQRVVEAIDPQANVPVSAEVLAVILRAILELKGATPPA